MVTRVKNGVVSTDDEDDLPSGGFVKNRRTTRWPEERERPQKHKTPRRPRDSFKELSLTTIPEEEKKPEIAVARPPGKKEEKKMESNVIPAKDKKIPFPVPGFLMCPSCGQYSKRDDKPYLSCKACDDKWYAYAKDCDKKYSAYADQIAAAIDRDEEPVVQPKVVLSKPEWILGRLDIASIEKELADARLTMEIHNKRCLRQAERIADRVREQVAEKIRDRNSGNNLPEEVLVSLRKLYIKQVTEAVTKEVAAEDSTNARNDMALVRYLNTWLIAAKKLKPELEQMITAAQKKSAEPAAAPAMTVALTIVPEPVNS